MARMVWGGRGPLKVEAWSLDRLTALRSNKNLQDTSVSFLFHSLVFICIPCKDIGAAWFRLCTWCLLMVGDHQLWACSEMIFASDTQSKRYHFWRCRYRQLQRCYVGFHRLTCHYRLVSCPHSAGDSCSTFSTGLEVILYKKSRRHAEQRFTSPSMRTRRAFIKI